jgi:mannose-1-phosphate guanylyltransferase
MLRSKDRFGKACMYVSLFLLLFFGILLRLLYEWLPLLSWLAAVYSTVRFGSSCDYYDTHAIPQNVNGYKISTPGFTTPVPSSPQLRARTPFLSPSISYASIGYQANYTPSPLGDNSLTPYPFPFPDREIPGFYVVIPAGGAGTRLWPLSREGHPKFLLDLTLKGRSLIQATWDRLIPLASTQRMTIVAGPSHVQAIKEQLPDLLPDNLLCEPGPKESMGAIGLAAAILVRRNPDAIIGSFAADHMISGDDAFLSAVAEAVQVAKKDYLVTIGIAPSHPSTGFGYVRLGEKMHMSDAPNARLVSSFKEKPDARTAAAYISTGNYRWNAGMFVTKATFLLELLKEYKPELHDGLVKIAQSWDDDSRQQVLDQVWPGLEKIAIDNAVAEPAAMAGRVAVVPATFGELGVCEPHEVDMLI